MRSRSRASMNRIRQFAEEFIMQNRRSPSCNEIAEALSMAKSTVYRYLVAMDEEGMIEYDHKSITTEKTQKTRFATADVPLIGSVSCGAPLLEEEYIQCYVSLPTELFGNGKFYLLKANGNSMIEAGIDDGDIVVVRRQVEAEEGQIVVALVENENTLKRIFYDRKTGETSLHPEIREMEDIRVKECMIQGVAVHVIKAL